MFAQKYQKQLMALLPFLQPQDEQHQNTTNFNKTSSNRQYSIDIKDDIQSGQASGQFTPNYNFVQEDIVKISAASQPNLPIKYQTDENSSQSNDQSINNNDRYQIMRNKPISECVNLFFGPIIQKQNAKPTINQQNMKLTFNYQNMKPTINQQNIKPTINQLLSCQTISNAKSFTYYQSNLKEKKQLDVPQNKQLDSPFRKYAQKYKGLSIETQLLTKLPKLSKLKMMSIQSAIQVSSQKVSSAQKYKNTWKTITNKLKKLNFLNFQQLATQLTILQNKITQQNKTFYNKLKVLDNKKQEISSVLKQSLDKWNNNKREVQDFQCFKYQKFSNQQIDKVQKEIDKNHHKFTSIIKTKMQQSNLLLIRNKRLNIMQIDTNTKLFQKYMNQIDSQFKQLINIQQKQLKQLDQCFNQEFIVLETQLFEIKSYAKTNQSILNQKFIQIDSKIQTIFKQQYDQGKDVQNSIVELMTSLIKKLQQF